MTIRPLRCTWFLLIVPLALLILSALLSDARGPFSLGRNLDPDYNYLFNSLNFLTFHTANHTDHPGTTLQTLGAFVLFTRWLTGAIAGPWTGLSETVLRHHEDYLHAINLVLALLIALTVFLAGLRMYRESGSWAAALILQASVFVFRETLLSLPHVSPEPLLVAACFTMMIPLIRELLRTKSSGGRDDLIAGGIFGFGMVTKVTFLPLAALVAVFPGRRQKTRFGIAFAAVAFACLLPILSRLSTMLSWFFELATHSEHYGGGATGLPPLSEAFAHLHSIRQAEPFLLIWLAYYVAVLIALHFGIEDGADPLMHSTKRLLWAGCICMTVQIAMAMKHFMAPRYVLPCLVLTSLINATLCLVFTRRIFRRGTGLALAICGAGLFAGSIAETLPRVKDWSVESRSYQESARQFDEARRALGDCTVIGYYSTAAANYPLSFGNGYSSEEQAGTLQYLYPNSISYNAFAGRFVSFTGERMESRLESLLSSGHCVLLQGEPLSTERLKLLPPEFGLRQVANSSKTYEAIYRLISKNTPGSQPSARARIIKAGEFSAGNVVLDESVFGAGIGVVTSPKYPAFAEYKVTLPAGGEQEIWLRYASAEPRPVALSLNGKPVNQSACPEATGGFYPADQNWCKAGQFPMQQGVNTIRLDTTGPFPHIEKLAVSRPGATR